MLNLFNHAMAKGMLFMASGSVIHEVHHAHHHLHHDDDHHDEYHDTHYDRITLLNIFRTMDMPAWDPCLYAVRLALPQPRHVIAWWVPLGAKRGQLGVVVNVAALRARRSDSLRKQEIARCHPASHGRQRPGLFVQVVRDSSQPAT